jgi:hypothetical protein
MYMNNMSVIEECATKNCMAWCDLITSLSKALRVAWVHFDKLQGWRCSLGITARVFKHHSIRSGGTRSVEWGYGWRWIL